MNKHLTMWKKIIDVGLKCWCCVEMLGAILLGASRWALALLEYYLLTIRLEILGLMCINALSGREVLMCHETNQIKVEKCWVFKNTHHFTKTWPNQLFQQYLT